MKTLVKVKTYLNKVKQMYLTNHSLDYLCILDIYAVRPDFLSNVNECDKNI